MKLLTLNAIVLLSVISLMGQTTAFVGVNVIPMDRERVLANQTVIVRNGTITEIGAAAKVKVPKDAVTVDGKGKYLIPGLVDMHTHLLSDGNEYPDSIAPDELRVMVANGVTTVRFMIGTPELLNLPTSRRPKTGPASCSRANGIPKPNWTAGSTRSRQRSPVHLSKNTDETPFCNSRNFADGSRGRFAGR